ncbi:replicative DNA helicase [Emticicia oligotrophica DSM 17448]|uniref:Replicative DNA helicase n=1 Tax=Emticicia oligotrophica (strain DSM 17448 / CIP 109782 / MTCC 6937 / GPTSA100-15) TaxID=929562 RepID=A0ABN4AUM6_EMTOG|nr:replicative DNA helicase [Emticicia oligotrophica DSM 17448]
MERSYQNNTSAGVNQQRGFGKNLFLENMRTETGKLPPQAVELEEAVLGALMIEKDALTAVVDILQPASFYKESHQRIYNAILQLFGKSEPIDMLTVTTQLRSTGELEFVGGAAYLVKLTNKVNSAANIEYHARIITQSAIKRDMIKIAGEMLKDAYEDTTDVFTLLDKVEQNFFEISERNIRKNYADASTIMRATIEELEKKKNNKDGLTGVASGFTALDRITSGWQNTELVIIAARPAMGKTAFVVSAMRNAAVEWGVPVALFSLEMSATQLMLRLISAEAEIDSNKLRKGKLENHEWVQLHQKIKNLSTAPIYIDDTPALSIMEMRAKCRRLKAQYDIGLVIIDYLQLMTAETGGGSKGNREQEIAAISRAMKNLAKEINVPVIALSQLSRAVETRGGDKRPQLSDLRESGSIEQDADMVMFLYRPEYYKITQDEQGNSTEGVGEVIIAKNRSGDVDTVKLKFIGKYTKFTDLDGFYSPIPGQDGFAEFNIPKPINTTNSLENFESASTPKTGFGNTVTLGSKANQPRNLDAESDFPF